MELEGGVQDSKHESPSGAVDSSQPENATHGDACFVQNAEDSIEPSELSSDAAERPQQQELPAGTGVVHLPVPLSYPLSLRCI